MKADEQIIKAGLWDVQPIPMVGMGALIKLPDCGTCSVIWTRYDEEWEHVSVSPRHKFKIPTWDDMCILKDIFFGDEEEVYQIHPPKSRYVNITENCLHLWKPIQPDGVIKGRFRDGKE